MSFAPPTGLPPDLEKHDHKNIDVFQQNQDTNTNMSVYRIQSDDIFPR